MMSSIFLKAKKYAKFLTFVGAPAAYGVYYLADSYAKPIGVLAYAPLLNKVEFDGSFGNKFHRYLIDPSDVNSDIWDSKFRKFVKDTEDEAVVLRKILEPGYGDNWRVLSEACLKSYKSNPVSFQKMKQGQGMTEFLIWKYCSPFKQKPLTIQEEEKETYSDKIGNLKKDSLISVLDESNQEFWQIKNVEFLKDNGLSDNHKYFRFKKNSGLELREICGEAYKLENSESSSESQPSIEEVVKHCTFS